MPGDPPCGPTMCIRDDGHPIESACNDPYCHQCEIAFKQWVFDLTDHKGNGESA